MRNTVGLVAFLGVLAWLGCTAPHTCAKAAAPGQSGASTATGSLDFVARITPTAARPEPVRQFTFYILSKSYSEIAKEVEAQDATPSREQFIDGLKLSPELKAWLKSHDAMDLTMPETDKMITPEDIIHVPEFLLAYQRSNSGGVTRGIPKPKYADADQTVNPQRQWARIETEHRRRVQQRAPEVAQTKYLVAKADTDLEGHCTVSGLPPGNYWISSLNLDANAGDVRLRWDVPATVRPGQTLRLELTNLNVMDAHAIPAP